MAVGFRLSGFDSNLPKVWVEHVGVGRRITLRCMFFAVVGDDLWILV